MGVTAEPSKTREPKTALPGDKEETITSGDNENARKSDISDPQRTPKRTTKEKSILIHPKYIWMSVLTLICVAVLYLAMILFAWTRYQDYKWEATLKSSRYFHDIASSYRHNPVLEDYFNTYMRFVYEIQETWVVAGQPGQEKNAFNYSKTNNVPDFRMKYGDIIKRSNRKKNMERAEKAEEHIFLYCGFLVTFFSHFLFAVPLYHRLQIKFRSRLLKMSLGYLFLALMAFITAIAEMHSVISVDRIYRDYEDAAINGSEASLLVASCGLRQNEFTEMARHRKLLRMRDDLYVCQNASFKLTASIIMLLVGLTYFVSFIILKKDYVYAKDNDVIPMEERQADYRVALREIQIQTSRRLDKDYEDAKKKAQKGSNDPETIAKLAKAKHDRKSKAYHPRV